MSDAFPAAEVRALAAVERKLPGRTAKQLNPHPPNSLAWAAWIIARTRRLDRLRQPEARPAPRPCTSA